jgi:hypothetical protein
LICTDLYIDQYWNAYTILTDNQPQENLHLELGLAKKLDIFYCWIFFSFIITLLLYKTVHPSCVDWFYREKLTCYGIIGANLLAVRWTTICFKYFWQFCDELGSSVPICDTILRCDPQFVTSRQQELWTMKRHIFGRNQFFSPDFHGFKTI